MISGIKYSKLEKQDMARIRPLWEKLRLHHQNKSVYFKDFYESFTYEVRMKKIFATADDNIYVEIAENGTSGTVGYCISSIGADGAGEVDSIYVEEDFRRHGIGGRFIRDAIDWMKGRGCAKITVAVANGNEQTFPFYERFGFRQRMTVLQLAE